MSCTFKNLEAMGKSTRACDYTTPHTFEHLMEKEQETTEVLDL